VQRMEQEGEWGGAPEIAVCAQMAGVDIWVYQPCSTGFELVAPFTGNQNSSSRKTHHKNLLRIMSDPTQAALRTFCLVCFALLPFTATIGAQDHDNTSELTYSQSDNNDAQEPLVAVSKRSVDPYDPLLTNDFLYDDEEKRAKYFLGKRGGNNKYFLGKRGWGFRTSSEMDRSNEPSLRRRAKYFLGKRSEDGLNDMYADEEEKRAKYFLGKRAKYFLGKRDGDKRMKYFLGKRSDEDDDQLDELIKRAKYFLGKRAGQPKRAKYFLGKRESEEEDEEGEEGEEEEDDPDFDPAKAKPGQQECKQQ